MLLLSPIPLVNDADLFAVGGISPPILILPSAYLSPIPAIGTVSLLIKCHVTSGQVLYDFIKFIPSKSILSLTLSFEPDTSPRSGPSVLEWPTLILQAKQLCK